MKKLLFIITPLLFLPISYFFLFDDESVKEEVGVVNPAEIITVPEPPESYVMYNEMHLDSLIDFDAFEQAFIGYNKIENKKKEILTLIDFSKPSTEERMYVLDMKNKELLFSSLVAHGKNSGDLYATDFSNKMGSNKSSLGFYITENTYYGGSGYSLILNGLEQGINDRAKQRAIVIHGSKYVEPTRMASIGKIGRSLGCPAIPKSMSKDIINVIKDGSLIYIYADDQEYLVDSPILSGEEFQDEFWG